MRFPLLIVLAFASAAAGARTAASRPATRPAANPNHTLLIQNGKIIDGTGNPWFYGDVLIRGSRIAKIASKIDPPAGADVIDATGLVVAPGFIDVHTHADEGAIGSLAENFIRDGVTTIVSGNCGGSPRDIGRYFSALREKGSALNVACLIGHNTILNATKGEGAAKLTDNQMEDAKGIVRKAMEDGAVGLSTGLIYRPGLYSDTEEIIELAKVSSQYGGIYATHMRNESGEILKAIDEALRIGREAKCRVEISHFKLPADIARKIGGANATLGRVAAARAGGQEVWLDQYPYTASSTTITTLLPDWVHDKGREEAKKRLDDPEQVKKMLADMKESYEVKRGRKSMAYAVVSSYGHEPNLNGRNLQEIAQVFKARAQKSGDAELLSSNPPKLPEVSMEDQYRTVIEICRNGGASCVFHTMDEQEVQDILASPMVAVASDSGIRTIGSGVPHPRGYGTNARVLARYVREKRIITLEDAIRKMTSLPAMAFRFDDRGVVRVGYSADLAIFDANKVEDLATFEKPHQYSVGIDFVVVQGFPVLRGGEMTGLLPGEPVLGPGIKSSDRSATAAR